ncbi:phthiocerol/phthiodiolone dimycocerosyl transferase family protein [Nocardia tengchongensis]|uniref:phthiocerol/phthiodiolone dimycocerosyl transferase family protein n=1 Tax=Nocardia tengchongensis TaxID=2055889 RepID=UPI0036CAFF6B
MTKPTALRTLARSEEMFIGMVMGLSVDVRGRLNLVALSEALTAVRRRYPFLGARLERTSGGYVLMESSGASGLRVDAPRPDDLPAWSPLDEEGSLSAVEVQRNGDSARVTFVTHHCVADARHAVAAFEDLWRYYTEADLHGSIVEPAPLPDPEALETLLATRVSKAQGVAPYVVASSTSSAPSDPTAHQVTTAIAGNGLVRLDVARWRLTADETAAIDAFARREGLTPHGLLSAAILLTEAKHRELTLADLHFSYAVDLRQWLAPVVPAAGGTNAIGYLSFNPSLPEPTGIESLARSVSDHLMDGLLSGIVERSLLYAASSGARPMAEIPGKITASNLGRIPAIVSPPDLIIEDLNTVISPRLFEDPNIRGAYIISYFADRLSIEFYYPASDIGAEDGRLDSLAGHLLALS